VETITVAHKNNVDLKELVQGRHKQRFIRIAAITKLW
jgi:hypothetical protein